MKKILILSSMVSLLILGCGSGGDSNDKKTTTSIDGALKIGDVAYTTPTGINFGNKMRTNLSKTHRAYKSSIFNSKETVNSCSESGTVSLEEGSTETSIVFKDCINYNEETYIYEYYDGTLSVSTNGESIVAKEYFYIPNIENPHTGSYMNLSLNAKENKNIITTSIDGRMKEFKDNEIIEDATFDELIMKNDSSNNALYLDGKYTYKAGCINESYTFKTYQWLIPNNTNPNEYTSGIITVNGMKYTYEDDRVTVNYQNKVGEFSQQELNEEVEKEKDSQECGTTPMK